jgi:NADH:ubiquinone oxidoreductase subunit 3 (subunit A)
MNAIEATWKEKGVVGFDSSKGMIKSITTKTVKFGVSTFLCPECSEDSKALRKGPGGYKWRSWWRRSIAVYLAPLALMFTYLIFFAPWELTFETPETVGWIGFVPIIVLIVAAMYATLGYVWIRPLGFRIALRSRFNSIAPFFDIRDLKPSIRFRNPEFAAAFRAINPTIEVIGNLYRVESEAAMFEPVESTKTRGVRGLKAHRNKIAGLFVLLILFGGALSFVAYHDGVFGVTSIQDISDGNVPSGTIVRVRGELTWSSSSQLFITDGTNSLYVAWTGTIPPLHSLLIVVGEVSSTSSLTNVQSVEVVWLFN